MLDEELPTPEPPPLPAKRKRWPTSKVRAMADVLPEGPGQLDGQLDNDEGDEGDPRIPDLPHVTRLTLIVSQGIRTVANRFRVSRQYKKKPTRVPDLDLPLEDLAVNREPVKKRKKRSIAEIIFPIPTSLRSVSTFQLLADYPMSFVKPHGSQTINRFIGLNLL
ncbi:hypothetical protein C8J57DRAFT_1516799 [Mycena rebaudengoi]|nr:hypothetical protein C8J57DRAFT_1516799 [Mycena rebaudengoi]